MWYYYSYIFSIFLTNVDCFMFNKPGLGNIQPLFKNTLLMTTNDYLSSIAFSPPFISTKVDTESATIRSTTVAPKVEGDYLSSIAFAQPFTSSKVNNTNNTNNTNNFTSTKLSNDYLSSIAIEPQSSPKYVKEQSSMSGTSDDYLSYISTAPPFVPTPVMTSSNVPTKPKTSNDYLSSIELPSKTPSFKTKLQDDYLSSIAFVRSKPNNYLSSLPSISAMKTENVYPSNNYQSYTTSAINLPNYFYAIDYLNKELHSGRHLISELIDCIGEKFLQQSFPFLKKQ